MGITDSGENPVRAQFVPPPTTLALVAQAHTAQDSSLLNNMLFFRCMDIDSWACTVLEYGTMVFHTFASTVDFLACAMRRERS